MLIVKGVLQCSTSCIEFYDASEAHDLQPSQCWNFGEGRQSIGNFRELDVLRDSSTMSHVHGNQATMFTCHVSPLASHDSQMMSNVCGQKE